MNNKKTESFKKHSRAQIAELRPVTEDDINIYKDFGRIAVDISDIKNPIHVSISDEDLLNGSPKIGDMVARNPKNHRDQWLVAEQYFKDNFEDIGAKYFSYFGEEDAVEVVYSEDTMKEVMYEIFNYMETYNCFHGETLHQKDDCIIYAPEVLSEIIDNILKPKFIKEL